MFDRSLIFNRTMLSTWLVNGTLVAESAPKQQRGGAFGILATA